MTTQTNKEIKMTNEIKNEITVTTSRGTEINVVSGLQLSEDVNLDGHVTTVKCCKKTFSVKMNGEYWGASELSTLGFPRVIKGVNVLATLGRCYLSDQDVVDAIQALVAKTESHPVWIAEQAKIAKNQKEIAQMETRRAANGYCPECGSYCYGDCEA
jgi:hypothetical protein